jgi:hypothetical protein
MEELKSLPTARRANYTGLSENPDAMAESKIVRTIDWKLMVRETGGDELYPVSTDPCERWNLLTSPKQSAVLTEFPSRVLE